MTNTVIVVKKNPQNNSWHYLHRADITIHHLKKTLSELLIRRPESADKYKYEPQKFQDEF